MENKIFRSKSIERISSPEELNDYVKVSNPGVWLSLVAIIILLIGACVWGIFGTLDTTIDAVAIAENGEVVCYIKEANIKDIEVGQEVRIDGEESNIEKVTDAPLLATENMSEYAMHVGSIVSGEWLYEARLTATLPDGVYECKIVTKSIKPISYLLN